MAKNFDLSDENETASGPFIIVGTDALPLLRMCLEIFQNTRDASCLLHVDFRSTKVVESIVYVFLYPEPVL